MPRRTGPRVSSIGPVVHLDFGGFPEVSCWLESWWWCGGGQSQESELNPELWTSPPPLPARLKDSRLDPESTARTAGREPERDTDNAADTLPVAAAGFPSPADRPSCEPRPGQSVSRSPRGVLTGSHAHAVAVATAAAAAAAAACTPPAAAASRAFPPLSRRVAYG